MSAASGQRPPVAGPLSPGAPSPGPLASVGPPAAGPGGTERSFALPRPGDVVAGKYAIVRVIGEGGMGIVYEAMHQRLRQRVALKMLLPAMMHHHVVVSRFEREARAAAQLRGRHCARVKDVDFTGTALPYMVMDFLEGHDLAVEIEQRQRLPVGEATDYVLQACAAMVEAHGLGIVHRDLKPSNLFLEREPDQSGHIVRVLDFGISKVAASEGDVKLTAADTIVGTAMYMSPEQIRDSAAVDARADIWALGVILFESLSGRVPWVGVPTHVAAKIVSEDAPDLQTLCEVPAQLAAIVRKALQRRPEDRFADVKELASALAPFAPVGSAGRMFADGLAGSSYPRVVAPIKPAFDSTRVLTAGEPDESAKTILEAPGVGPDTSRTTPEWERDPEPAADGKGRAVLAGVMAAVAVIALSVAIVAFVVRRPANVTAAPIASETKTIPMPSSPPLVRLSRPHEDVGTPVPSASVEEPPPSGEPSARKEPLPPVAKTGGCRGGTNPPCGGCRGGTNPPCVEPRPKASSAPPASRTAPPKAATTGAADKPLFL